MRTIDFLNKLDKHNENLRIFAFLQSKYQAKNKASSKVNDFGLTQAQMRSAIGREQEQDYQSLSQRLAYAKRRYSTDSKMKHLLYNLGYQTEAEVMKLLQYENFILMNNLVRFSYNESGQKRTNHKTSFLYFDIVRLRTWEIETKDGDKEQRTNLLTGFIDSFTDSGIEKISLMLSFADNAKYRFVQYNDKGVILESRDSKDTNQYTISIKDSYRFPQIYKKIEAYVNTQRTMQMQLVRFTDSLHKFFGLNIIALENYFKTKFANGESIYSDTHKELKTQIEAVFSELKDMGLNRPQIKELMKKYSTDSLNIDLDLFAKQIKESIKANKESKEPDKGAKADKGANKQTTKAKGAKANKDTKADK